MSSHLSHKLPWYLLVDYVTTYKDPGISLPIGICNRIHITNKKVELQVKNRTYIQEDDICKDSTCILRSEEQIFYKSTKRKEIFASKRRRGRFHEEKFTKFLSYFEKVVLEFAHTELNNPAKDLEYEVEQSGLNFCENCSRFITLLEFGDKKELFKYSDQEIADAFACHHSQAIGKNLPFLMYQVLTFYLTMNIILHANVKEEDWPCGMKPGSYFRGGLFFPHDGQTFLPHSRKYLSGAMIDLEQTKILNKNLFKFIYFYVMMNLKINKNYSFLKDLSLDAWLVRRIM